MSKNVKGQFNMPRNANGELLDVLQPGYFVGDNFKSYKYTKDQLIAHSQKLGYPYAFPCDEDIYNRHFWKVFPTSGNCPEYLVSKTGIAVGRYHDKPGSYRVLQQQWNNQDFDPGLKRELEELLKLENRQLALNLVFQQRYLQVRMSTNPDAFKTSSAYDLHRLVGTLHSDITTDLVYWDGSRFALRPYIQVDHEDKDKSNNSFDNLKLVTPEQNRVMIGWFPEEKREYYDSRTVVEVDLRHELIGSSS